MKIFFKFPTRERPEKFLKVLDTYLEMIEDKENYEFIINADLDDKTMHNSRIISEVEIRKNCKILFAPNETKVQAINVHLNKCHNFDILVLVSDDMIPVVRGFDNIIRQQMSKNFPDLNGALWFNDGRVGRRCNTLVIIGRPLLERFGYIYHPTYKSEYCDNEYTERLTKEGKLVYIDQVIIDHQNPHWTKEPKDELYKKNHALKSWDKRNYNFRKEFNLI